jgi:dCMP deaminase
MSDAEHLYADREPKYARVIHAEVNAVLHARERLDGYTLYSWPPGFGPTCDRCATVVIQAGITRVVYRRDLSTEFSSRWAEPGKRALDMYSEAGVEIVSC